MKNNIMSDNWSIRGLFLIILMLSVAALCQARFAGGEGSEDNPYQIATAEHLNNIRTGEWDDYLRPDIYFVQTSDIDLHNFLWDEQQNDYINDGQGWEPIGDEDTPFQGNYNGGGFVIENLYIDRPETRAQGLFGYIAGATIKNVALHDLSISGHTLVGGLTAGMTNGSSVISCQAKGTIRGGWYIVGLLVGLNSRSSISNSFSKGSVNGDNAVGGFVGETYRSTIRNCYTTANVRGSDSWIGGFVGSNREEGFIENCYSNGNVIGEWDVGGFCGENDGVITNSYWDTETSGHTDSQGGEGRTTEDLTYPYGRETYEGWDFDEIWRDDVDHEINNGYPALYSPIAPDTPLVSIEIVILDNIEYALLSWDIVEDANSYIIYSSTDPYSENWGDPIDVIEETAYHIPLSEYRYRFFRVSASSEEP